MSNYVIYRDNLTKEQIEFRKAICNSEELNNTEELNNISSMVKQFTDSIVINE